MRWPGFLHAIKSRSGSGVLALFVALFSTLFVTVGGAETNSDPASYATPALQATALKEGRRLFNVDPIKAEKILKNLIAQKSVIADYATYDLATRYITFGRFKEAGALLVRFQKIFPHSPLDSDAREKLVEATCHEIKTVSCRRLLGATATKDVPPSFRPRFELYKAESKVAIGSRQSAYRQYQRVYYHYPTAEEAEAARRATVHLRKENPSKKYPTATYTQKMARIKRLVKQYAYDSAETELSRMKKTGYSAARQEEILYELARVQDKGRKRVEAKRTYLEYLLQFPKSGKRSKVLYLIAIADWNLDNDVKAKNTLESLLTGSASKNIKISSRFVLGRIAAANGDYKEARRQFDEGLLIGPSAEMTIKLRWQLGWIDYRQGEASEAAKRFLAAEKMDKSEKGAGRFAYWAAQSLYQLGQANAAKRKINKLAKTLPHTYYGALANKAITPCIDCVVATLKEDQLVSFAKKYEKDHTFSASVRRRLVRFHAFIDAALYSEAKVEADAISKKRPTGAEAALWVGILYRQAGRSGKSIILQGSILSKRKDKGDFAHPFWRVFYPVDGWVEVAREAKTQKIDPFLVLSVIRQESAFDPDALSPANARGLMQIIPDTGRKVYATSRYARERPFQNKFLFDPEVNIHLGVSYLNSLLKRYSGNTTYALAAYNAGEAAVDKWISRYNGAPDDEFIEMIPYAETRGYVKRVKRNLALYHEIYLQNPPVAVNAPPRLPQGGGQM